MGLKPFQEKIIQLLIDQEDMLSELYAIFASQFPEHQSFFEKLSREEDRHAKLVQKLYDAAQKDKIIFEEGKIKTYTLEAFLTRLRELKKKAQEKEFTIASALICAADYETSLIEKNVFVRFDSPSDKVRATLKILQSETLNHVERVRTAQRSLQK